MRLGQGGCGQKLGLPGGSSCTHTQTGFVQLSFTSSLAYVLEPRFVSWDTNASSFVVKGCAKKLKKNLRDVAPVFPTPAYSQ